MDPQTHPDPFHDAMNHALQRAVQVASSVVTGAQVLVYLKRSQARTLAERDQRARRALAAHTRADGAAARAGWAPALDRDWARDADLAGAAKAWGAAMPYADPAAPWHEPAAATAMRRCEDRLRVLHPQAMARYDRLRGEGQEPADAMREAAPLFGYPPDARDAPHVPRAALTIGDGGKPDRTAARPGPGPAPGDILADPASTARAGKTQAGSARQGPPGGASPRTARPERSARPWERDFPMPIRDVVATAGTAGQAAAPASGAAPGLPRRPARQSGHRP